MKANTPLFSKRLAAFFQAACAGICLHTLHADTPKTAFSASEVEAVFLVNFCRFTTWPSQIFNSDDQPITIALWSDDEFASLVEHAAKGERIGNRPVRIKRVQNAAEADSAQLLFVSETAELSFEKTFESAGMHTLLVGESNRFLSAGGHLQFVTDGKIKVRVNLSALRKSGLELSSNLLRICQTQ